MVPRSRRRLTPRLHMFNDSTVTPLIVALPRTGDPLSSPTTYPNKPSGVTRPHHRNSIDLTQPELILHSNMTTRGPIQHIRIFPTNRLEPPSVLLPCPLVLGQLTLFLTTPAHNSRLFLGVSHLHMVTCTLFARSRLITPHRHTIRHPPMPHSNSHNQPRLQVHQHHTNNTKTEQ
jgi:hypothetical protein